MKNLYPLISILFFHFPYFSTQESYGQNPGEWMWIHGSNTSGNAGSFGTQGVPNPSNEPPALYEACEWTDLNGNFWLYGGVDQSFGTHNDLWKYDPVAKEWTWMTGTNSINNAGNYGTRGVPSPANRPPSKGWGVGSWVDNNGDFWMFGGYGAGYFSDLWKYNIATNEWTWMKGPNTTYQSGIYGTIGVPDTSNIPGCRGELSETWRTNNGDLWFFGGQSPSPYYSFNDMWRYNIAANTWTWMKGSNLTEQVGTYGVQGVENAANTPGARAAYGHWKDNNGNLWLFGGDDYYYGNSYNDMWRYNPVSNNWAWIGGSNTVNSTGNYGTKCITSATNVPSARYENRARWTDANGNFWLFGGYSSGFINDLWMYCLALGQWTWEGGDATINSSGSWGTKGVSSPTNKPNCRNGSVSWSDNNGHLFFFGGSTNPPITPYNDLWVFKIDSACGSCPSALPNASFTPTDTTFCGEGTYCITFSDHSTGNPTAWQWLFPGAVPDSSSLQNPTNICYANPGTYPVTLIVTNSIGTDTLTISPMITFSNGPQIPSIIIHADTLICPTSGVHSYLWYFNGSPIFGATDSFYVFHTAGTYAVLVSDSLGCSRISNGILIASINESYLSRQLQISPNPVNTKLIINTVLTGGTLVIFNSLGDKMIELKAENGKTEIPITDFASGVYYIIYRNNATLYSQKFIKE